MLVQSDDNKVFAVLKDAETAERAREEAKKKETAAALAVSAHTYVDLYGGCIADDMVAYCVVL